MGRSLNDKIITIRFNEREYKMLEFVLSRASRYYCEPVGSVIKTLIFSKYNELKERDRDVIQS